MSLSISDCKLTRRQLSKCLEPRINFEAEINIPSESTYQELWIIHLDKPYQELAFGCWMDERFFVKNLGSFDRSQCHKTENSAFRHNWAMWTGDIADPDYDNYSYG